MPEDMMVNDATVRSGLTVDVAKYQAMIDDPDLPAEEKRQFIEALWHVIVAFVDLGFGVHPVQQACGQLDDFAAEECAAKPDVLGSKNQPKEQFTNAAAKAGKDESG